MRIKENSIGRRIGGAMAVRTVGRTIRVSRKNTRKRNTQTLIPKETYLCRRFRPSRKRSRRLEKSNRFPHSLRSQQFLFNNS